MALGVVGGQAVLSGKAEAVGQVDAEQWGWHRRCGQIIATVLEDRVAQDGVADVWLTRGRHRVAENRNATGTIERNKIACPGCRAADEVEGHSRLVGLRRSEW